MLNKKEYHPKKSDEEIKFDREVYTLKPSAECGAPFPEEKKGKLKSDEIQADFLARKKTVYDADKNPDKPEISELFEIPNFPKAENLSDDQVSVALEIAQTTLKNKNIVLDVIYSTPERELYRFITEELLTRNSVEGSAGGMPMHFIYEEHYPNFREDIKDDITQTIHFVCRGHRGTLPWRIANKVTLHGESVTQAEFEAALSDHRAVVPCMSFIGIDSINIDINEPKAHAKAAFRFYLDQSSGSKGEVSAEAEFFFDLIYEGNYLLTRLVIDQFGIA